MPDPSINEDSDNKEFDNANLTVVVLGATGAVGRALIKVLAAREPSWIIRAVTRDSTKAEALPELRLPTVQVLEGDILVDTTTTSSNEDDTNDNNNDDRKPDFFQTVTQDADIVFQCMMRLHPMTVQYAAEHWPLFMTRLLQWSKTTSPNKQKRLVLTETLQALDTQDTSCICLETAKRVPAGLTSHAAIRSSLWQQVEWHVIQHPLTTCVICTSDYFAPHVTERAFLGSTFTERLCHHKAAYAVGSATQIHDFCFLPDLANALHVLSKSPRAFASRKTEDRGGERDHEDDNNDNNHNDNNNSQCLPFWMAPHAIQNKTLTEIAREIHDMVLDLQPPPSDDDHQNDNNPQFPGVTVLPALLIRTMAHFNAYLKEVAERLVIWKQPYHVDDHDTCQLFNLQPTPHNEALHDYVSFYLHQIETAPHPSHQFDD